MLGNFQANLTNILFQLRTELPEAEIYVSNLYDIPEIPMATNVVLLFNSIVDGVASAFGVPIADVFSAFEGRKELRLIQRNGADQFEVHPSNAGHWAMAKAFKAVIENN